MSDGGDGSAIPTAPSLSAKVVQSEEDAALIAKDARLTPAQRAKRDEQRALVIKEIQTTERSYVQALDALQDAFVTPLKAKMAGDKPFSDVTQAQVNAMCSNLETLHNFHHNLIQSLETVQPDDMPFDFSSADAAAAAAASSSPPASPIQPTSPSHGSIPAIFLRFSEFFRLYIPYLNGYERSLNTFNELRKHKKFSEWLNVDVRQGLQAAVEKNGGHMSALDLQSYMIQPVQRVPRYVLLLKELKRQTSPSHPEFAALGDALIAVQRVATVINEAQRTIENMSKLMAVQQRIIGEFETLIQPHRRLIREGTVSATYTHGMFSTLRTRRSVFFLFSDLLVWTSEEFKFKGSIDLTPAKVAPKTSLSFMIDTAQRVVTVSCDTENETKSWFEAIDNVICQLQNEREKLRQRARVQKSRNLNGTANKDAVHKLVTQSLQGLALGGAAGGAEQQDNGSAAADSANAASSGGSATPSAHQQHPSGTYSRTPATLGQRSGRSWTQALTDAQRRSEHEEQQQQHQAQAQAASRASISANTFAPPDEPAAAGESSASAAAPAAASSSGGGGAAPKVMGPGGTEKKFQVRFVNRRGRSTLGKRECMCTLILIHAECPLHGVAAAEAAAAAGEGGGDGGAADTTDEASQQ
jgi:hypothetical protein